MYDSKSLTRGKQLNSIFATIYLTSETKHLLDIANVNKDNKDAILKLLDFDGSAYCTVKLYGLHYASVETTFNYCSNEPAMLQLYLTFNHSEVM